MKELGFVRIMRQKMAWLEPGGPDLQVQSLLARSPRRARGPRRDLRARKRGLLGGTGEMTVNIAIGTGITVVVVGTALVAYAYSRTSAEYQSVNGITQSVLTMYQGEPFPNGVLDATIINEQKTGNAKVSGNTILNGYGGTMSWSGTGTNVLTVTDTNIPANACIDFMKSIPRNGWDSVAVNGGTAMTSFGLTNAQASTACSETANTIVLTVSHG